MLGTGLRCDAAGMGGHQGRYVNRPEEIETGRPSAGNSPPHPVLILYKPDDWQACSFGDRQGPALLSSWPCSRLWFNTGEPHRTALHVIGLTEAHHISTMALQGTTKLTSAQWPDA